MSATFKRMAEACRFLGIDQVRKFLSRKQRAHFEAVRDEWVNEKLEPDPNWQVVVQNERSFDCKLIPGYVQIDDVTGGENKWSKGPGQLRSEGVDCPDFSRLLQGRYKWSEAVAKLAELEAGA